MVLLIILKLQSLDRHFVFVYRGLAGKKKEDKTKNIVVITLTMFANNYFNPSGLSTHRVGVCLPFRRFAIIVAWLKKLSVITDGFKRQASPSTCMGTGIPVVMRAVLHWHNGVPVPPVCNLV